MTEILGSISEIRMAWRCKPEQQIIMIRYMIKKRGHPGVVELAKVLNVTYQQLYEIAGLKGWIHKRNCQRRQRGGRQSKKTGSFSITAEYVNEYVKSKDLRCNGSGKLGNRGSRQDPGRRAIEQSIYG